MAKSNYLIQTCKQQANRPDDRDWKTVGESFRASAEQAMTAFDRHVSAQAGLLHKQKLSIRLLKIWCGGQDERASLVIYPNTMASPEVAYMDERGMVHADPAPGRKKFNIHE